MKVLLLFYLIGVILMFILVLIANRGVNIKKIKPKPFLKTLALCLGSWVAMYIVAIHLILDN